MTEVLSPLMSRILRENRKVLALLAGGLVFNILLYGFGVYPLSQRVANVSQRNQSAAQALVTARQENGAATGALAGKDRAVTELATFYTAVLPKDLASARRLTHLRIAQLARQHGLRYARATSEPVAERNSTLTRLKTDVSLGGSYGEIRAFVHTLETAPEFVVIDNIQLAEDGDGGSNLTITLALSTFYRSTDEP
ncbi:MAG TPA: GspMb/PilO family protein [Vicinamibacterales bacterium]